MRGDYFEFLPFEVKDNKEIIFNYKTGFKGKEPVFFKETIILPRRFNGEKIDCDFLNNLLQDICLIIGTNYFKAFFPKKIKIKGGISKERSRFWNKVYKKGYGEFLYKNKFNPKDIPLFPAGGETREAKALKQKERVLLGMGGGKESVVSLELLKKEMETDAFVVENQRKQKVAESVAKKGGVRLLRVRRIIDEKVIKKQVPYSGHLPISLIYAFLGYLLAYLYNYSFVAVGNEASSNFGNVRYKGLEVNHQWSKSSEAESGFQNYSARFLSPSIKYFSALRPFSELRIARDFSSLGGEYFTHFASCNKNFSVNTKQKSLWCNNCAKCVFTYLLLSPFLSRGKLKEIFGEDLFNKKELLPLFSDILGFGKMKPFDCVGTFEEAQSALYLAKDKFTNSALVKEFGAKVNFSENVFKAEVASTVPHRFRFLGMKNAYILGYGIEGKESERFIKSRYPKIKIRAGDKRQDSDYLKKQENYDLVIKTPGIKKENITRQYTTATNIFFSRVKNKVAGITGSKGKSTTSFLLVHILKEAGRDAKLAGNIGKPMLSVLEKATSKTIFVVELSSYQLDDISFSPSVAVALNLFPEHLTYHGSLREYYGAKENIVRFQNENDIFIFNPKSNVLRRWASEAKSASLPIESEFLRDTGIPSKLKEKVSEDNIMAAAKAAAALKVSKSAIIKALKTFKPLSHRLEFIGEYKGIKFYDDAISTAPQSAIFAIKTLKKKEKIGTIFLGGEDRGLNYGGLEKEIEKAGIKNIVLFPDCGERIIQKKKNYNILRTKSMETAVKFAYKQTNFGEICLLSSAAPSYSVWKNFEEKGDLFKKYVKKHGNTA